MRRRLLLLMLALVAVLTLSAFYRGPLEGWIRTTGTSASLIALIACFIGFARPKSSVSAAAFPALMAFGLLGSIHGILETDFMRMFMGASVGLWDIPGLIFGLVASVISLRSVKSQRSFRSALRGLVSGVATIVFAIVMLSRMAPWYPPIDLLNDFMLYWILVLGFMSAIALIARRWILSALCLIALGVGSSVVAPIWLTDTSRTQDRVIEDGSLHFRLLTWNVRMNNSKIEEIAHAIDRTRADICILQETSVSLRRRLESLASFRFVANGKTGWGKTLVCLQRKDSAFDCQLVDEVYMGSDDIRMPGIEIEVRNETARCRLLGFHATSPRFKFLEFNNSQLRGVAQWANSQPSPCLVAGDLNATSLSNRFRRVCREGDLRDARLGYQATYVAQEEGPFAIRLPIDHILCSPKVEFSDPHVLAMGAGSDHDAFMATIVIGRE